MEPARVADRFVIDGVAGKGGMGTVYRAHDERTGERVAIKVITNATDSAKARFSREADALMRVNHAGVVRYVAHGATHAHEPYLVMAWIDGKDLAARLGARPLALGMALELARGVANALAALHAQGLVHRDLKPQNILLADGDPARPVLVDLGIARRLGATAMTATGGILGTPQYRAPEQIEGRHDLDHRADLFALGCVLFECIAGRAAFTGDNAMAVLAKIMVEHPPPLAELGVASPPGLETLLAALLAKRPSDRPATALDVASRLAGLGHAEVGNVELAPARLVTTREHRAITVAMATGPRRQRRSVRDVGGRHAAASRECAARQLRARANDRGPRNDVMGAWTGSPAAHLCGRQGGCGPGGTSSALRDRVAGDSSARVDRTGGWIGAGRGRSSGRRDQSRRSTPRAFASRPASRRCGQRESARFAVSHRRERRRLRSRQRARCRRTATHVARSTDPLRRSRARAVDPVECGRRGR